MYIGNQQVSPKVIWKSRVAKSPISYSGTPQIHPKTAPSLRRSPPHLIHPSLDRTYSPPQTASGSTHPFCHSTLSGPTDRQTDRWSRRETCTNTRLRSIDYSDAANKGTFALSTRLHWADLFRPGRSVKYCHERVCVSVCVYNGLSVRSHISKTRRTNFANFMHVARSGGSVLLWRRFDT